MKLFYVANVRVPTEKAHGVAIVRACEAFARAGVATTLVVPNRRTPIQKTVFEAYSVQPIFAVKFLPTIDRITEKSGAITFWIQMITFQISLIFFLLFKSRQTILYTRDPGLISLRLLGYNVVFECHLIHGNRTAFFALARKAHRVIVISEALKQAFIEQGFEADSVLVAPSGVDLSVFDIDVSKDAARKELDLPPEGTIALYTGNFTTMGEDKGISDIIKALPAAPGVTFVGAGGSDKDRERYAKEADTLGVSRRVILRGPTTQATLALYQKAANVLLMPFPDTPHYRKHMSPVKMFEYMAAKRPIIASDLPTIREVLNDTNAIIVPPGNYAAIASAMSEESRMDAKAQHAYEDVQKYSWDLRAKRVWEFIS